MAEETGGLTRRKFLSISLGCLTPISMVGFEPYLSPDEERPPDAETNTRPPVIRKLGRTGLEVPIVNMGSGPGMDPALVRACYETGMRLFDTAAGYREGRHEEMLGRVFSRMGVRDTVLIMNKVHLPELSRRLLHKTLEGSLRRLKTDYIDILLIQDVSDPGPIKNPAIMEAMSGLKEQGKTRFIGTATHTNMAVAINATVEAGIYDIVLTSLNFTMADDVVLLDAIRRAAENGVGVIAMKTQAGGRRFPNRNALRNYSEAVVNSAALKWVCHNENIATAIPGMDSYEHMRVNFNVALDPEYTDEEKEFLSDNEITSGFEFCRQCRSCVAGCPGEVDIPTLMRTHMYVSQYGDFHIARRTLDSIARHHGLTACTACAACTARCVNRVNIPRKIAELKLIYA